MGFVHNNPFRPAGDQPKAIEALVRGLEAGVRHQVLLGVTGSGKTATISWVIEKIQRPTLIISHNKTLAAQLTNELRTFFPNNAVEYFVSYYDYYQPEAYLPTTDTYIEKEAEINEEIDRLRHAATSALMSRRDVIIVATVSCIYGLGSPVEYQRVILDLAQGKAKSRLEILESLVRMYYTRNDVAPKRGEFRARGSIIEVHPIERDVVIRIELRGDRVDRITTQEALTGKIIEKPERITIFPARHYVLPEDKLEAALRAIELELEDRLAWFREHGKLLEADRLKRRTKYDLELIREIGYCHGIENYSRHFDGRKPGEPPMTLIEYFRQSDSNFLCIIDESHVTIPQLSGMYHGDWSRKKNLVDYGWRLPSAFDNRPLTFQEWEERVGQVISMSATPGPYELAKANGAIVEQIVRPTGLVDPKLVVRPARPGSEGVARGVKSQVEDLIERIHDVVGRGERVLITTLTKKMAEELAEHLQNLGFKVAYLHHEVGTIERIETLAKLRKGVVDVICGVNLLREGLDLPEVSLVAVLDADREGFLRSDTSLIQIIGRAARNVRGSVVLYADSVTDSMKQAISETERRRAIQLAYNKRHGIVPKTIVKPLPESWRIGEEILKTEEVDRALLTKDPLKVIKDKERAMREAANRLDFELAAILRDEILALKRYVAGQKQTA